MARLVFAGRPASEKLFKVLSGTEYVSDLLGKGAVRSYDSVGLLSRVEALRAYADGFDGGGTAVLTGRDLAAAALAAVERDTSGSGYHSYSLHDFVNDVRRSSTEVLFLPGAVRFLLKHGGLPSRSNLTMALRVAEALIRMGRAPALLWESYVITVIRPEGLSDVTWDRLWTAAQRSGSGHYYQRNTGNAEIMTFKRRLKDLASDKSWNPGRLTQLRQYVGLEIEFNVTDADVGPVEVTCFNCDGSAELTLTDAYHNEYEVTCATCDGSGTVEDEDGEASNEAVLDAVRDALEDDVEGIKRTSVAYDGSLGPAGAEVRHCYAPSLPQDVEMMRSVLGTLSRIGSIDTKCGLHVHLSFRKGTPERERAERAFTSWLPLLLAMVSPSRKNDDAFNRPKVSDNKYSAVMTGHENTIEVRVHQGTLCADKINGWVTLIQAIGSSRRNYRKGMTQSEILSALGLSGEGMRSYLAERLGKFSPDFAAPPEAQLDLIQDGPSAAVTA